MFLVLVLYLNPDPLLVLAGACWIVLDAGRTKKGGWSKLSWPQLPHCHHPDVRFGSKADMCSALADVR